MIVGGCIGHESSGPVANPGSSLLHLLRHWAACISLSFPPPAQRRSRWGLHQQPLRVCCLDAVDAHDSESAGSGDLAEVMVEEDAGIDHGPLGSHSGQRPTVSIKSVMPEVGEEGRSVTVTLKLSRPLSEDEKFCYDNTGTPSDETRKNNVCIQGALVGRDSYQNHLHPGVSVIPTNIGHKFVFFAGQTEKRLSIGIDDDECITPNRQIVFRLYGPYQDRDEDGSGTIEDDETVYGYDFDPEEEVTVRVIGNDDDDAPGDLWPLTPQITCGAAAT